MRSYIQVNRVKARPRHFIMIPLAIPFLPLWAVWKFLEVILKVGSLGRDPERARLRR